MEKKRCMSCFREYDSPICPYCGYPEHGHNERHQLAVGTVLRNRYQIGRVLGQGGFGITYLGWDKLMQTTVAVKEFFPSGMVYRKEGDHTQVACITDSATPHFVYSRERFLREASALVQFKHLPVIVDILDFVEENDTAYIVMEFVKGMDLGTYVKNRGGRLTVEETFRILVPVMQTLATVHRSGIVHRDISPDNIILDPMGGAKLLDFGAVRSVVDPEVDKELAKSTEAIIKHGFAPIEQYNTRGSLGPWTDCYAVCATVWYCLTGQIPTASSVRLAENIDPDWGSIPGLSAEQQLALRKGFSCRAKDRYASLDELLEDLFPVRQAAGQPMPQPEYVPQPVPQPGYISQPVPQPEREPVKRSGKKGKVFLFLGIGAVAVAAAAAVLLFLTSPGRKYDKAHALLRDGSYEEAMELFTQLDDYEDSEDMILECQYAWAEDLLEQGEFQDAIELFTELDDYEDSEEMITQCHYAWAEYLLKRGSFQEAIDKFTQLGSYSDSKDRIMDCHYAWAEDMLKRGLFQEAIDKFVWLGSYRDSADRLPECYYSWAEALLAEGKTGEAAAMFGRVSGYRDARGRSTALWAELFRLETISGGEDHTLAVKADGTVVAVGENDDHQCDVGGWTDIVSVSAGDKYSIGMRSDGTVVSVGLNDYGQCNVGDWTDIIAVSAGYRHTLGLKRDGTVVVVGSNITTDEYTGARFDAASWTDIIAIGAGGGHSVGLKADGTVLAAGYDQNGQCDVGGWTDIVAISVGVWHTVGLKSDGTVVVAGTGSHCDVSGWTDIVAISAGKNHTIGLKLDGTVVSAGTGTQCDVTDWTDIVAISTGELHSLGLKSDGTLVAVGNNTYGQCNVTGWTGIRTPVAYD